MNNNFLIQYIIDKLLFINMLYFFNLKYKLNVHGYLFPHPASKTIYGNIQYHNCLKRGGLLADNDNEKANGIESPSDAFY